MFGKQKRYKMGVIKGVLKEELENSIRMLKRYEQELKKYPGGSFIQKEIRGHKYYYLAIREGKKVHFIYKGKSLSKQDKATLEKSRRMRKKTKAFIQKLKKRIIYIEKTLRGKEDI